MKKPPFMGGFFMAMPTLVTTAAYHASGRSSLFQNSHRRRSR